MYEVLEQRFKASAGAGLHPAPPRLGYCREVNRTMLSGKCPACGAPYKVSRLALGKKAKCDRCGKAFVIPRKVQKARPAAPATQTKRRTEAGHVREGPYKPSLKYDSPAPRPPRRWPMYVLLGCMAAALLAGSGVLVHLIFDSGDDTRTTRPRGDRPRPAAEDSTAAPERLAAVRLSDWADPSIPPGARSLRLTDYTRVRASVGEQDRAEVDRRARRAARTNLPGGSIAAVLESRSPDLNVTVVRTTDEPPLEAVIGNYADRDVQEHRGIRYVKFGFESFAYAADARTFCMVSGSDAAAAAKAAIDRLLDSRASEANADLLEAVRHVADEEEFYGEAVQGEGRRAEAYGNSFGYPLRRMRATVFDGPARAAQAAYGRDRTLAGIEAALAEVGPGAMQRKLQAALYVQENSRADLMGRAVVVTATPDPGELRGILEAPDADFDDLLAAVAEGRALAALAPERRREVLAELQEPPTARELSAYKNTKVKMSPAGGEIPQGRELAVSLKVNDPKLSIRYTLDGGDPTVRSSWYREPIRLRESATLKARAFLRGAPVGRLAWAKFISKSPREPDKPRGTTRGLEYGYYEGNWGRIPDFAKLKPVRTGQAKAFSLKEIRHREDGWGARFAGYLKVGRAGGYTFFLRSDDGSRLSIGDQVIVDNDGAHDALAEKSGSVMLQKGFHRITLDYFQERGEAELEVRYEEPGARKRPIPSSALYRSRGEVSIGRR